MAEFLKPDNLNIVWASGGDRLFPGNTKYSAGWGVEIPPRQYFNEIDYKQDQMLAHLNQRGIAEWDAETEYQAGKSYVQDVTGTIYRCVLTNVGNNPSTDTTDTYWEIAFATTEDSYTKAEVDNKTALSSTVQAQLGESNDVLMTPLRTKEALNATGAAPLFGVRAWANLTGGSPSSTATIRAAGNVQSISRISLGVLQVTFATPMPDADYAVVATGAQGRLVGAGTNADTVVYFDRVATGFKLECWNTETDRGDLADISFIVVR